MSDACMAYVEKGGMLLANSRSRRHTERRHRHCKRMATTERILTVHVWHTESERELKLCGEHARLFDQGRANVDGSDW
jgi:hypothetical protein